MSRIITSGLVVALSAGLLWYFGMIWMHRAFFIQEPNIYILTAETLALLAIFSYGMASLWRGLTLYRSNHTARKK